MESQCGCIRGVQTKSRVLVRSDKRSHPSTSAQCAKTNLYQCRTPSLNFEISSPRKRDFRHSEANSACFKVSFFKVKMPFFSIKI